MGKVGRVSMTKVWGTVLADGQLRRAEGRMGKRPEAFDTVLYWFGCSTKNKATTMLDR